MAGQASFLLRWIRQHGRVVHGLIRIVAGGSTVDRKPGRSGPLKYEFRFWIFEIRRWPLGTAPSAVANAADGRPDTPILRRVYPCARTHVRPACRAINTTLISCTVCPQTMVNTLWSFTFRYTTT